jgi:HK97 family phage prohead protease
MLTKSASVLVKAAGTEDGLEEGQFEAIVSVFGNVDSYGDRVVQGAFAESLAEWDASGNPIPIYWAHQMQDPDFNLGHVLKAEERPEGLWVLGQLDLEGSKAATVYRLMKGRRVTQFSFAYDTLEYTVVHSADDDPVWELTKLKLHEVGPCPIGVNQETSLLAVKAAHQVAERVRVEAKAGRVLSASNETTLRTAYDSIGSVLSQLEDADEGKASAAPPAKAEEPVGAKAEEQVATSSVSTDLHIELEELEFASITEGD